jgi:hypothetical protein
MDRLPAELVDYLYCFLDTQSIKSLRIACKSFAEIGESHLFNEFEFRLYPQLSRLGQLRELSEHPTIASQMQCLTYESGIQLEYADYRYWKAQVYQAETNNFSRGITSDGKSQDEYVRFHTALEARFTPDLGERYEEYRRWLDHQAGLMAHSFVVPSTFASTLSKCSSLKTIKIVMSEPEITLDDLATHTSNGHRYVAPDNCQPGKRIEQRRENCLLHFMSLLKAVHFSGRFIRELKAIDLPKAMLNSTDYELDIMNSVFQPLKNLEIKVSEFPHSDWLSRGGEATYFRGRNLAAMTLRKLLNEPRELQSLDLTFPKAREAEFSFDIFDQTNLDRFPRKWLPGLKQLALSNSLCTYSDMQALLNEATGLESLTLRDATLETGSLPELLVVLHKMKLKDVCIDGHLNVPEDSGVWHSHNKDNYYECTHYEGTYATNGMRSKVESYIINGGEPPLIVANYDNHADMFWPIYNDTSWHLIWYPRE